MQVIWDGVLLGFSLCLLTPVLRCLLNTQKPEPSWEIWGHEEGGTPTPRWRPKRLPVTLGLGPGEAAAPAGHCPRPWVSP